MLFLDPVYHNNIGATYLIKDNFNDSLYSQKIQLLIGDVAILLEEKEINALVKVIDSVKNGCSCDKCMSEGKFKQIKCDTDHFKLVFKSTKTRITDLEDLLRGTIFELQINSILSFYGIN